MTCTLLYTIPPTIITDNHNIALRLYPLEKVKLTN